MKHIKIFLLLLVIGLTVPQASLAQKKKTHKSKGKATKNALQNNTLVENLDNMTADELWQKFCSSLEKNDEEACVKYVKKAAEKKHPEAMFILGIAYIGGDLDNFYLVGNKNYSKFPVSKLGIIRDDKLAGEMFKEAAEKNFCLAMLAYGTWLSDANMYDEAFRWLSKAADYEESYNGAVMCLGKCYLEGWGCEKNEDLGIQLLSDLAKRDANFEPFVCDEIGRYFYLQEKYAKAAPWLHRAAELDDVTAMNTLATMYQYNDMGVPKNYNKAYEYAKRSFDKGNIMAKSILGIFYLKGIGVVEQDHIKAKQLFKEFLEETKNDNSVLEEYREYVNSLLKSTE